MRNGVRPMRSDTRRVELPSSRVGHRCLFTMGRSLWLPQLLYAEYSGALATREKWPLDCLRLRCSQPPAIGRAFALFSAVVLLSVAISVYTKHFN